MIKNINALAALALAAVACTAAATGCEVIAGVDRDSIPGVGGATGSGGAGGTSMVSSTGMGGATGGAGGACAGMAMCQSPSDCAAPSSDCVTDTCSAGCCGTTNNPLGDACATAGGKVCDGNGACVACVAAGDCPATGTACLTPACSGNTCTPGNAPKGTACSDAGGVVCDGNGACVAAHCADTVKDADETDVDCGGSCPKCGDGLHCGADGDCTSGHCLGGNPGTCVACIAPGDCTPTGNECIANTCVANACGTTNLDQTHTLSTGQTSGDCQKIVCDGAGSTTSVDDAADLPVATTVCETNPACTGAPLAPSFTPAAANTDCTADNQLPKHLCGAGALAGSCVECNAGSDCAAASCVGTTFTPAETCSAGGSCVAGASVDCALTNQVCNVALGCVACNTPADCPATGNECIVATCAANVCGTQDLGQSHALSTGQTPGDCQQLVCNGAGGTISIDDPTDLPVSPSVCLTNPACIGSPLAPAFSTAPPGTDCTADNNPPKHVCGSGLLSGSCVDCNSNPDCPVGKPTCTNHVCI